MRYLNWAGYLAIPLAYAVHYWLGRGVSWEPVATFFLAGLGVVPFAALMGEATESLADKTGPTWGGLLNATFGNAAELIIGIVALSKGLNDVVKASLTGSILGNLLLVGGGAMLVGGWGRERQLFSKEALRANAGLLVVAVAAGLLPAVFHFSYSNRQPAAAFARTEMSISVAVSIVLLIAYGLGLLFTLKTHAHIFSIAPPQSEEDRAAGSPGWSVSRSVMVLLAASVAIALLSELLVGSADSMAARLGWNHVFVGVVLLAIIGNAAEHSTALLLAHRNDMDTAMTIAHQSSLQIALFAVPVMVLVSLLMAHFNVGVAHSMDLVFSPLEVVGLALSVTLVTVLGFDGETNWFEGALLLAVYVILGIAFFYIPAAEPVR